jgi:hypothetical protein
MNQKQRKAKRQRANQHRKIAKTAEYKRKRSDKWIRLHREHEQLSRHWLDEPIEGMRMMTDEEWRAAKIEWLLMFAGALVFIVVFCLFLDWVSK